MIGALYWQDGLSLGKIAARLGCSAGRVGSAMRAAGIPRRDAHDRSVRPGPWWVTRDELTVLYVDRALTAREVAAELGCDPAWVSAALRRYRIARLVDPVRLYVERATLTRLYVTERLDDPQIAARYGVPPWRVTRRRRELDVHRPRTRHPDTPTPDLPAAVADEHLADPTGDPALAALHRDPEIAAWLRRHHIPRHPATPAGGAAGPGPAELTRPLLQRAYQHIGLSAPQIGSLTGRATPQVIHALHTPGIPVHGDGATSPWQHRRNASRRANRRRLIQRSLPSNSAGLTAARCRGPGRPMSHVGMHPRHDEDGARRDLEEIERDAAQGDTGE